MGLDAFNKLGGLLKCRARHHFDPNLRIIKIHCGLELKWQHEDHADGCNHGQGACANHIAAIAQCPFENVHIPIHHLALAMLFFAMGFQEIGGNHGGDHAGYSQAEHNSCDDGESEILKKLAGDARHHADRQEDSDDGECGCNHRQTDFIGGFNRCLISGFAHPHMAHDILDFDDGIIDQNARHKAEREHGNLVQAEAQKLHKPEGWDRRQRNCDGRNDRCPPISEEKPDDQNGQNGAFNHCRKRRFILRLGIVDRGVELGKVDFWIFFLDLAELYPDSIIDLDVGRALGALN